MNKLEKVARELAAAHRRSDPDTTTIKVFPARSEIRLLEVSATAPTTREVLPFRVAAGPALLAILPRICLAALLVGIVSVPCGRNPFVTPAAAQVPGMWEPVSDGVLKQLSDAGKKPGYPGGTAGVSVDRATGRVRMIVPDQGLWLSSDEGVTFTRADGGAIGGRCETGYALNADPAGRRLACFMLDGQSALTLDGGKTWSAFQQLGRGWDFGAVDWSQESPQTILAIHHESGEELQLSTDAGKSWKLLGKDFTAIGVFGPHALVATKGDGILRSTDGGATWTKVSDLTPTGRVASVLRGVGFWVSREGLLVSRDMGKTWSRHGAPLEAAWGPFFGKDDADIVVVGKRGAETGFFRTENAGETWKLAAPFPNLDLKSRPDWTPSKDHAAGWFFNFGWDPVHNCFYASKMGFPTVRYTPVR